MFLKTRFTQTPNFFKFDVIPNGRYKFPLLYAVYGAPPFHKACLRY